MARYVPLMIVVCLVARVAWADPVQLPGGQTLDRVDFERHVAPLLSRLGCNSGACHGSSQGQGGLRLSLFGYDPAADREALAGPQAGRVDRDAPDSSLLLRKVTAQVKHGGGRRIDRDSWQYNVLRGWIADGSAYGGGSGAVAHLEITPRSVELAPSTHRELRVVAQFADGTRWDVTPFCDFRVQNDFVATVNETGLLRGTAAGDTAVIATYGAHAAAARIYVPVPEDEAVPWPDLPEVNVIDEQIFKKLRRLRLAPSQRSGDAEFFRRVYLTTTGQLPTTQDVRAFLADTSPDKRLTTIDELLKHPLHAATWATRFSEITGNSMEALEGPDELKPKRAKMWHDWLRRRFTENMPYDALVRDILCATSRGARSMREWIEEEADLIYAAREGFESDYAERDELDLFWRRDGDGAAYPTEEMAERVAAAFLGVRIACARCHKHPFDRWTQNDYRSFANVFAQVRFDMSPELRAKLVEVLDDRRRRKSQGNAPGPPLPRLREVYLSSRPHDLHDVKTGKPLPPRPLGGPQLDHAASQDRRAALADWLTGPDNPYFAANVVNRVWAHYFGRGLVEPVDAFSAANPPSHPKLLERLSADFVAHDYDLRRLERMILTSTAWQLSSIPNGLNARDRRTFARAYVRVLPAETLIDALHAAIGTTPDFGESVPAGIRAVELAPSRLGDQRWDRVLTLFGRPEQAAVCDCERSQEPSVRQALYLMSDPHLLGDLSQGRIQELVETDQSNEQIIEELFLASLSRFPTADERAASQQHIAAAGSREQALADVLWGLINTQEFVTNH